MSGFPAFNWASYMMFLLSLSGFRRLGEGSGLPTQNAVCVL